MEWEKEKERVTAPLPMKQGLGAHLQRDLPRPRTRNCIFAIDNPGHTRQGRLNGRDAAAWGQAENEGA